MAGTNNTKSVLCRYYMHGACNRGATCAFSHDMSDIPNMVCKYYLAGSCAYGDKCRYDHKRPDWTRGTTTATATATTGATSSARQQQQHGAGHSAAGAASGSSSRAAADADAGISVSSLAWSLPQPSDPSSLPGQDLPEGIWQPGDERLMSRLRREAALEAEAAVGGAGAQGGADEEAAWEQWNEQQYEQQQQWDEQQQYDYQQYAEQQQPFQGEGEGGWWGDANYDEAAQGQGWWDGGEGAYQGQGQHGQWGSSEDPQGAAAAAVAGGGGWQEPQLPDDLNDDWAAGGSVTDHAAIDDDHAAAGGDDDQGYAGGMRDPADLPLCSQYSAFGKCHRGDACNLIHGTRCDVCHKFAIHPYNPEEANKHMNECLDRHGRLQARLASASVECCICMEKVTSKDNPNDRRFGLLPGCDHPFCLACIRSWRNSKVVDVDTAARTCPVCRVRSWFVVPSSFWPQSPEDKEVIMTGYKDRLATIDCKAFAHGSGTCPFGTSCFYRHAYPDGTLQDRAPQLRKAGAADGVHVLQPLQLSAFFATPQAARTLAAAGRARGRGA